MNILITGKFGQLGKTIHNAIKKTGHSVVALDKKELDITNIVSIRKVCKKFKPNILINTAAYTKVDLAEDKNSENFLVNHIAVRNLAIVCKELNIFLIHFSSDYVFDGTKKELWHEDDNTNPINMYGQAKLMGENEIIKYCKKYIILRTSWVFSDHPDNFVQTILMHAKDKNSLSIISDQIGNPTSTYGIASALVNIIPNLDGAMGIYNFSEYPEVSWATFASSIIRQANDIGLLDKRINIVNINSSQYPTKAARPKNSALCTEKFNIKFGFKPNSWEDSLKLVLTKIKNNK